MFPVICTVFSMLPVSVHWVCMIATRSYDPSLIGRKAADRPDYGSPVPYSITPSSACCSSSIDLSTKTNASENSQGGGGSRVCHTFFKPPSHNNQPHTEWPMCFSLKSNISAVTSLSTMPACNHWQDEVLITIAEPHNTSC